MNILITGTSSGIGLESAKRLLNDGHTVIGFDILPPKIEHENFHHYFVDVSDETQLPDLGIDFDIVIDNAATIDEDKAIKTNLEGYINIAEKYSFNPNIKSVIIVGSISGIVGLDTPRYAASQGGRISYMKNLALRLGKSHRATVNCVSFGAVMSGLEPKLYARDDLVEAVANENILHKWIMPDEAADWIWFMATHNKSMIGQNILIDNGEEANYNFIDCRKS